MSLKPRKSLKEKLTWANLALAIVSIVVTFCLIEAAARIYLWNFASPEQFNQYASANQLRQRLGAKYFLRESRHLSPHRYIGYYPTPNFRRDGDMHNSLGYRGEEIAVPKPEGTYRIVCLGGSTTYSVKVKTYKQAYPYQLQEYLRGEGYSSVEVVNAGANGYSSWESLVNLEFRVLDLEPDMIIVYHGVNEIDPRLVWPPSAYVGDNSGSLRLSIQKVRMPPIWQYSTALRILAVTAGWLEPHSTLDWHHKEPRPDTYYGDQFVIQRKNKSYPSGTFLEVPAQTMLDENPPIYFERNLRNMVALARENDVEAVLLTFAYSPYFTQDPLISSPEYQRAFAEGNEAVKRAAAATDAHLYDFAQEMPPNTQYWYSDGRHFTEEGEIVHAQLIGDYLIENGLLPEPD